MQSLKAEKFEQRPANQKVLGSGQISPVRVNIETCNRLAQLLARKQIPLDEEDSKLKGFSPWEVGNLYLFLVAICHQTSPRGRLALEGTVDGKRKRGWDYLSARFEAAVRLDRSLLTPCRWAEMTVAEFIGFFSDPELGDRLSEPDRRTDLIRNLGRGMLEHGWMWFEDLYQLCEARAATGEPNLFGLLSQFAAYRDPVRKKSSFLLALMRNSGLWRYIDEEKVGPPVDYHEVRGHLRIGTVTVVDVALRRKLLESIPVTADEDVAIRGAVYDAIMLLSNLTGLRNPSQMHYLFWNVFRNHCLRDAPLCYQAAPGLPVRYRSMALDGGHPHCPFSDICASASSSQRYFEHVFETDYY